MSHLERGAVSRLSRGKNAPEARYAKPRILIDCAFVSAESTILGILKVVFKYIENGYRYGEAHNLDVLPVYVNREGVVDARYNLPAWTYDAPGFDTASDFGSTPVQLSVYAIRRLQRQ